MVCVEDVDNSCIVCLTEFENQELKTECCKKTFCDSCAKSWYHTLSTAKKKFSCPQCKSEINKYYEFIPVKSISQLLKEQFHEDEDYDSDEDSFDYNINEYQEVYEDEEMEIDYYDYEGAVYKNNNYIDEYEMTFDPYEYSEHV